MPLMTQSEYAQHIGVSQPRVHKMIQTGKIPKSAMDGKRIISELADKALGKNLEPARKQKSELPVEEKEKVVQAAGIKTLDYTTARTLNEQYKAALNKLEYEQKSGKLIDASEVEKRAFLAGRLIRDQLLSIPDRCSALVAAESDAFNCKQIILKEINYILENLSDAVKIQ